jgi:hypothetical protein
MEEYLEILKQLTTDLGIQEEEYEEWLSTVSKGNEGILKGILKVYAEGPEDFVDSYSNDPEGYISSLQEMFEEPSEEDEAMFARKGAKLQRLLAFKKGGSTKCKCGCNLVRSKEKGGKIVSKCACGCKSSLQEGGKTPKKKLPAKPVQKKVKEEEPAEAIDETVDFTDYFEAREEEELRKTLAWPREKESLPKTTDYLKDPLKWVRYPLGKHVTK